MSFSIPIYGGGAPFFTGEFSDPRTIPYTISLDGRDYPIDLTKYRHNGLARFRNGVVTSNDVNDSLLNPEGAWWRYRFSWHQGEGQAIDELDEDSLPARYLAGRGVNPWTKYQFCLHHDTEEVLDLTAAAILMVSTGGFLYVGYGTTVKRSADLVTWSDVTGLTGTVQAMTTDGSSCYIATTTNIYAVASTLAASTVTSATAPSGGYDSIGFVGNRLIASGDNVIYEIKTSTIDAIYTHYQSAFRWTVIFAVGSRIYLGGFAGNRSELYTTTTDDTGALVLSAEASSFFAGELLHAALNYGGQVVLGTSEGIRFATLGGDATLQYGPIISAPGAVTTLAAQGRHVWFNWEDFPGAGTGTGRLALDEFVSTLQPSYASDIFTEDSSNAVVAVARFDGKTVFAVSEAGVYAEDLDAWVTTGYLDSGDITFGSVENKSISEINVRYAALADGESVTTLVTNELDTTIGTLTDSVDGSTETRLDLAGDAVDRARVRLTINGDGTSTPCVNEWRMRGYPVAPGVEEWLVPLIIHSQVVVNDSEGQILSMDPWVETAHIRELWQDQEIVLYKEGDYAFRVRIDNFQIDTVKWRDGSDYFEVDCTVRLLGI